MSKQCFSIGETISQLPVSQWLQGGEVDLLALRGQVVLIEVFQVNCPGCFLYGLPMAVNLQQRFAGRGFSVLAVATAFEDFDKNTLANLQALLSTGEVTSETHAALAKRGGLQNDRWPMQLPFPVAMDDLRPLSTDPDTFEVEQFIASNISNFDSLSSKQQQQLRQRVLAYLQNQLYQPQLFSQFALQGTPSYLLLDKQGVLRFKQFGDYPSLSLDIEQLLAE